MYTAEVTEALEFFGEVKADEAIERACFNYLEKQGYTLWANWEIQREERRRIAAGWFAYHFQNVMDEMNTKDLVKALNQSRIRRRLRRKKERVG